VAVSAAADSAAGVAVVGGGFIGMELASSLTQRGRQVHVIDSGPYVWRRFADRQLSEYVMNCCAARGVKFHTGQRAGEVRLSGGKAVGLATSTGEQIDADLVIIAAGIVPNVELARQAGLACENGVLVNDRMQSSNAGIYAVGDVANYPDPLFHKRRRVEHWGQADYTGDLAGRNAAGADEPYNLLSYVWSDIFELHLEFAGMELDYDRLLVRGQMQENRFALLHLKQDRLTAYYSVNLPKADYRAMGKLIEKQVDLSGRQAELANPAFALEELTAAPAGR
jgi:NADPH-dependent 2,4-dienoyl-CoA reductase/sulfur reductase-like enzyme